MFKSFIIFLILTSCSKINSQYNIGECLNSNDEQSNLSWNVIEIDDKNNKIIIQKKGLLIGDSGKSFPVNAKRTIEVKDLKNYNRVECKKD
jgi:hypothetical protein